RTSGENLFDLFMAPSSQELEPPQKPGRFKATSTDEFPVESSRRFLPQSAQASMRRIHLQN
ncbi:hypothetical protein, partial [Methylibium sp.]|uniref:hypothetical protein n=1 Tax=Methylibium sp. TaxID=2067992 RepID=UPI00286BF4CA